MKTQLLTFALTLLFTMIGNAQKTYLKITNSEIGENVIMYPPGTEFELKTKEGYIIFKNSSDPGLIEITEKHTLYVYPSWKDSADVFVLTDGKVEKVLTSSYRDTHKDKDTDKIMNNGVTASSKVTDSETLEGKKNIEFKLSNGITFNYTDGLYSATLGEKNLTIKHKYIVYSDIGILKLSFNPSNGVVWWVFEDYNH